MNGILDPYLQKQAEELLDRRDLDQPEIQSFLKSIIEQDALGHPDSGRRLKIFISGPISKRMDTYKAEFEAAAETISRIGYIPLNPAILPTGMTQADYMRITLAMLQSADAIMMLPGWDESAGARLEREYATYTGIPCVSYSIMKWEECRMYGYE